MNPIVRGGPFWTPITPQTGSFFHAESHTVGAVDMAPVAIAADDRLGTTAWVRAQKQPGLRQTIVVATTAPVMRPPMAWTRAVATAMMPLQSCLCTVCRARRRSKTGQVMDRRRACLPMPAGLPHHPQISRGQTLGPECHPGLPRWVHRNLPPLRFAARQGRSASGRVPPMDYLDNPARRRETQPSDRTSANSYGFWPAFTVRRG